MSNLISLFLCVCVCVQVHHQLQKMGSLVKKMGEIVARETRYVERMPLTTFLQENTESLLREADTLIVCQVYTHLHTHTHTHITITITNTHKYIYIVPLSLSSLVITVDL